MYPSFRPRLLASTMLSLTAFTACQKTAVEPEKQPAATIIGRWALTQTAGGIGGGTRPADPQRHQEVEFLADGQAHALLNGTPTATGTYTLSQAVAYLTQRTETFIEFAVPQTSGKPFIAELSATTLVLRDDGNDGYTVKYQRVLPLLCGTR